MTGAPLRYPLLRARRWAFLGLVIATTAAGGAMMLRIVGDGGLTLLEAVILGLFVPTFAWIVVPFWTALAGFALRIAKRHPITLERIAGEHDRPERDGGRRPLRPAPRGRTALAVPVYNEDPRAVAARVSTIAGSLMETGTGDRFHIHILSDTSDAGIARAEEDAWLALQAEHPRMPIFYRRRELNAGRKAGNVGEFCRRCLDDYEYLVVLDADSLMTGDTLVSLALTLDANPDVGLVQTVPLPVRARTLFGRLVQFAGCLYSPLLAAGQSFWQVDAANYWGHNAIIRLRPFVEHARLPRLSGRPPLGGEILSHDFVEAALLRQAGWKVILDPTLEGSWEEVPGTIADFAARDRRWAQGSLQHLRLLRNRGLHPLNRVHFALGAMGYVSSLLWLLILVAGTAYVLLPDLHGPTLSFRGLGAAGGLSLLTVTAVVLFLPKALGLLLGLATGRARYGGAARLVGSGVVETVFSVLMAPIMMLYHTRFVAEIALGRSVEWNPPVRDRAVRSWSGAWRATAIPTALGLCWGGATLAASPLFSLWMSPIFLGLLLSAPLARVTGAVGPGRAFRSLGFLLVGSETSPHADVRAVRAALSRDDGLGIHPATTPRTSAGPTDPSRSMGVQLPPGQRHAGPSQPVGGSMHHAERGLFDLRQGRPFLVIDRRPGDDPAAAVEGVLVAGVEGLDAGTLDRLRSMSSYAPRLLLTRHRVAAMKLGPTGANGGPNANGSGASNANGSGASNANGSGAPNANGSARVAPHGSLGTNGKASEHYALQLDHGTSVEEVTSLSCGPVRDVLARASKLEHATPAEAAALSLIRLGRLLPAVVAVPVQLPPERTLREALESGAILQAPVDEVREFVDASGAEIVLIGEAPVPLAGAEDSRFMLFRETHGLQDHVAILVGEEASWPDPTPVRLHSACLTGDLFGSLRCDCGEQLRASMEIFSQNGGGVLLYLAQEGRGIGLRNKFRAYTLQEGGLDTIEADGTLGFGPDERRYDVAGRILQSLGVKRIELLTNNPDKVRAMEDAGIAVVRRIPLHGTLTRHNLPYVRAKVHRAGHWLGDMLSQPLSGD